MNIHKNHIIFTGGGSGGHLFPSLTLIERLKNNSSFEIVYIGGIRGIESDIVKARGIKYFGIQNGKLRRYFSIQNLIDIFRVFIGIVQSGFIQLKYPQNTIVFSTGGFVTVPVVISAWLLGRKILVHEQTSRVGLANKIASFFADKIFISFEASRKYFSAKKTVFSGYPLRDECFQKENRPVSTNGEKIFFATGGGNGSELINQLVVKNLPKLKKHYKIIHQVGKLHLDKYEHLKDDDYLPLGFCEDVINLFKNASVIVSRSGAGTVAELMALEKPSVFIPLKIAQKNEQFHNAMEAKKRLGSIIIEEDELNNFNLLSLCAEIEQISAQNTKHDQLKNGVDIIIDFIEKSYL